MIPLVAVYTRDYKLEYILKCTPNNQIQPSANDINRKCVPRYYPRILIVDGGQDMNQNCMNE